MSDPATFRIIVVDDDPATCRLLQRQLEDAGYQVATYQSAQAALQPICDMNSGIVIVDWMMPGMTGPDLCRALTELQEMGALGQVHIILLSAHQDKEKVIEGLAAGAHDYLTKPYHLGELLARVKVGERMIRLQEQLLRRNVEVQKANAQMAVLAGRLESLANTDVLTQLPNRRAVFQVFEQAWEVAVRDNLPLCCVMIDIDRFKRVNDTHGHAVGDQVLVHVASIIRQHAPRPQLCGRIGGEEFVLILPATTPADAVALAERLREHVARTPAIVNDQRLSLTVSCGVAARTPQTAGPDELISDADGMLYAAKENGRNQTWVTAENGAWYPANDLAAAIFCPLEAHTPRGSAPAAGKTTGQSLKSECAASDHQ